MRDNNPTTGQLIFLIVFALSILYMSIATKVFLIRHPKINQMALFHEPKAVLTFGTVEKYR